MVWLFRDGRKAGGAALLEGALRETVLPRGAVFAWVAAEIEVARRLRGILMAALGLARGQIQAAGYWRIGAAGAHARLDDEPGEGG